MCRTWFRGLCAAGALSALVSIGAQAQTVIKGKVSSGIVPLGGASVFVEDMSIGAVTTVAGTYSFTVPASRAKGQTATLVARYIGYKPQRLQVTLSAGTQTHDFDLEKDVLQMEEVVVTGVAEATSTKKLAFSVGVVSADQIKEAPAVTPLGALNGKVAGVDFVQANGAPGAPPAIRLRAATSLSGSQEPLIIIDGTITRTTLADISSDDIDRVEIIKGAAASSLYGSDAANGVVQIWTKRGANNAEGQLSFTFRNEYGNSYLPKTLKRSLAHAYQLNADGSFKRLCPDGTTGPTCPRIPKADGIADQPYPVVYDQQKQSLQPGLYLTNYLSVAQRSGKTNFAASFQNTKENGVVKLEKGYSRQNFRVNVDQAVSDKLDMSMGAFFGKSDDNSPAQGAGSPFFGLTFLEPNVNIYAPNPDGSPYAAKIPDRVSNATNPLYNLANENRNTDRTRYTGTGKATYRPFEWLTADANFNYDEFSSDFTDMVPFGYLSASGVPTKGSLRKDIESGRSYNTGATLTATHNFFGWMDNTTKAAWVYEDQIASSFSTYASSFTVPKVPEFTAATGSIIPNSGNQTIRNQNAFLISTFDIKSRYILDGLIRQDQSSLFGSAARSSNYYRASAAYRLNEDLHIPGVDELKLRASIGTAGLRPQFDAQYETFTLSGGAPQKQTLGNKNLKPAKSTETELGFNIDWLKNYRLEYSYSKKRTEDQILLVPLSAATGYINQWRNAGTLDGETHELSLSAVLLSHKDVFWRVNLAGDRTRSKITKLNVAPYFTGPDAAIFRIAQGQAFGVIYGAKWVHNTSQLYDDPAKKALSGPGQAWSPDSVIVNEEGFLVRKNQWRTPAEGAIKYVNAAGATVVQIGDVNPDFTLSGSTQFTWKAFSLNATLSWVKGGNIYNYTRQWPFFENRDWVYDQRAKPVVERKSQNYYNVFYNSFDPNDYFVENGGYVKLRELSMNYAIPSKYVTPLHLAGFTSAKIGLVGRNLLTFTKYSGYDPEVSGPGGGDPFTYRVDYFSYPNFRTFTLSLELGY